MIIVCFFYRYIRLDIVNSSIDNVTQRDKFERYFILSRKESIEEKQVQLKFLLLELKNNIIFLDV